VLDEGKREKPPSLLNAQVPTFTAHTAPTFVASGSLTIAEMFSFDGLAVLEHEESNQSRLVMLLDQKLNRTQIRLDGWVAEHYGALPGRTLIGFTPKLNQPVALNLFDGRITFLDIARKEIDRLGFRADELAKSGDRFYVRSGGQVLEVEFSELVGKTIVTASHVVASVMERASRLFEGCCIQSMLGSVYVSLFPRSHAGYQVRVPELDRYKVVDAKFDGGVLMVTGAKDGVYDRLTFRFNDEFDAYDLRTARDVAAQGLNFVTLANGVCVCITEDEKLEVFSATKGASSLKVVSDPALGSDMRLMKVSGKVGFERAGNVYSMSLK
jgi:hypothetical protein